MTNEEIKLKNDWVKLTKEDISVKCDDDMFWCFGSEKACLRLWYEYTRYGIDIRNRLDFGYSTNLETWYFTLKKAFSFKNQQSYQWHDVDDCLPEENVYVVCRYDDYYFIGYMEDGIWYNHSAADTILATDDAKVEYWKMFENPYGRD